MVDPSVEFQVRLHAIAYAMQSATPGEDRSGILAWASLYTKWMLEPLQTKAASDALGVPVTERVQ